MLATEQHQQQQKQQQNDEPKKDDITKSNESSTSYDYHVPESKNSTRDYYLGMIIASWFTLIYFIAPFYMLTSMYSLIVGYPSRLWSLVYSLPVIVSAIIPSRQVAWILPLLKPICTYFQYEEIHEKSPINVWETIFGNEQKKYICVFQPHGAISFVGICSACTGRIVDLTGKFPTAVADALLYTPILKHVLGIFGLISASKRSLQHVLRTKYGPEGCIVLYVGGLAELFLSNQQEEVLYLLKRKGFIKLALQEGVDILPIYLFGNTTVLSVLTNTILATLSRKLQVSLTYIWGRYYLPIPRDCKLLYVSGQPLGMPKIENPTQADIDYWHQKYCSEVTRIFNTYKERVPEYKHKQLRIV